MQSLFLQYLTASALIGYIIVFFGMFVEGEIFLFTGAFLAHEGYFHLPWLMVVSLVGMMIGDLLWFRLGKKLNGGDHWLSRWARRVGAPFDAHLLARPRRTIFISKFTYGLHHAVLVRAGALNLKWSKFWRDDLLAIVIWVVTLSALGYFSSASFALVKHYLKFAEVTLAISLVIFLIVWHFLSKRQRTIL